MKGRFVVRTNEQLLEFSNFEDIPMEFDNVIAFEPDFPEGPHTEEQHKEIDSYPLKLFELLKRGRYDGRKEV